MDRFITIARIVKVRGLRGEVAAEILTDFPERFASTQDVRVLCSPSESREQIESHRFHNGRVLLKFLNRDSPEEAQELVGGEVQIPEQRRSILPEGSYYETDLIGSKVVEDDQHLGHVVDLFRTGREGENLVVKGPSGQEFMIPLVREFVLRVDVDKKLICVNLPSGLVDVETLKGKRG